MRCLEEADWRFAGQRRQPPSVFRAAGKGEDPALPPDVLGVDWAWMLLREAD
jgi:hypothetical protein